MFELQRYFLLLFSLIVSENVNKNATLYSRYWRPASFLDVPNVGPHKELVGNIGPLEQKLKTLIFFCNQTLL